MENPQNKWRFLAGKIIYFYGPSIPWLFHIHIHNLAQLTKTRDMRWQVKKAIDETDTPKSNSKRDPYIFCGKWMHFFIILSYT